MANAIDRSPIDVVLECEDFDAALDYYTQELNFRIDTIFPADSPRVATISDDFIRVTPNATFRRRCS
ncbi:MAG: hypothetical protein ACE5F8_01210 [Woeseiaceae bacterium]